MASLLLMMIDDCIGDDQIIKNIFDEREMREGDVMSVQPCYIINYGKRVRQWVDLTDSDEESKTF